VFCEEIQLTNKDLKQHSLDILLTNTQIKKYIKTEQVKAINYIISIIEDIKTVQSEKKDEFKSLIVRLKGGGKLNIFFDLNEVTFSKIRDKVKIEYAQKELVMYEINAKQKQVIIRNSETLLLQ
jgi:hypothetical protein